MAQDPEDERIVTSTLNLRIDIRHRINDPHMVDAETIGTWVARDLARTLRLASIANGDPAYSFGRRSSIGAEDSVGVDTFIQSAVVFGLRQSEEAI